MMRSILFSRLEEVKKYSLRSFSVIVPVDVARLMGMDRLERIYCYVEDGVLVYSPEPPDKADYVELKPRVVTKYKCRRYYMLTIPVRYVGRLGLKEGTKVIVQYSIQNRLMVIPFGGKV